MAKVRRILNVTNNFRFTPERLQEALANCAIVWVEHGKTVRNATPEEARALRMLQSAERRAGSMEAA